MQSVDVGWDGFVVGGNCLFFLRISLLLSRDMALLLRRAMNEGWGGAGHLHGGAEKWWH